MSDVDIFAPGLYWMRTEISPGFLLEDQVQGVMALSEPTD